jgi:diguanylate cyclase (GGDEF)-like protein
MHSFSGDSLSLLYSSAILYDRQKIVLSNGIFHYFCYFCTGTYDVSCDQDGFKAVNDELRHVAGDTLLVGVAERLRAIVHESDTVGRYAGNEFIVLPVSAGHEPDIADVADKILTGLAEPICIDNDNANVSATIIIAIALRENGEEPETLLHKADVARDEVKAGGKIGIVFIKVSRLRPALRELFFRPVCNPCLQKDYQLFFA